MNKSKRYSPEVRERAVRLLFEHQGEHESQWSAMNSIASKIGCTAETLRKWVRQSEIDHGKRSGLTSSDRDRLKELERDNRELKRAKEILRKAAAFFAQAELDRRLCFRADLWTPTTLLSPVVLKVLSVPTNQSGWLYDVYRSTSITRCPTEQHPE